VINLGGDIEGLPAGVGSGARSRRRHPRALSEGASVTAMIINIDRKNRAINLSIKAKEMAEEAERCSGLPQTAVECRHDQSGGAAKAKLDVANTQQ